MVKVQWADAWLKGGEITIPLTHHLSSKEKNSVLHEQREFVLETSKFVTIVFC